LLPLSQVGDLRIVRVGRLPRGLQRQLKVPQTATQHVAFRVRIMVVQ
jgi:hypothetical protein